MVATRKNMKYFFCIVENLGSFPIACHWLFHRWDQSTWWAKTWKKQRNGNYVGDEDFCWFFTKTKTGLMMLNQSLHWWNELEHTMKIPHHWCFDWKTDKKERKCFDLIYQNPFTKIIWMSTVFPQPRINPFVFIFFFLPKLRFLMVRNYFDENSTEPNCESNKINPNFPKKNVCCQ